MAYNNNIKYIDDWNKQNTERIVIKVPKGNKQILESLSEECYGKKNITRLMIEATEEKYNISLTKDKP